MRDMPLWGPGLAFSAQARRDRGNIAELASAEAASFNRRVELASWLRLTRLQRGGISRQFRYLRDPPPAYSEYSPQLTQRSRQRLAADEMELLLDYWPSLVPQCPPFALSVRRAALGRQPSGGGVTDGGAQRPSYSPAMRPPDRGEHRQLELMHGLTREALGRGSPMLIARALRYRDRYYYFLIDPPQNRLRTRGGYLGSNATLPAK